MTPLPLVLGLTICEKALVEERTRNVSLVSTFTILRVDRFPTMPQRMDVYSVVTDGLGDATIDLVVTRLDTDEEVYALRRSLHFPDRLTEVRLLFRLEDVTFPAAGWYQFVLYLDGEWLAQRRLRVLPKGGGS